MANIPSSRNSPNIDQVCGWTLLELSNNTQPAGFLIQLDLITFPFLLTLSTVGNVINLIILLQEKSGGKNAYLVAIAVIDIIYMWCAIWSYTINYDQILHDGQLRPSLKSAFDRVAGLVMFFQEAAAFGSSWLIVAFSMDRLFAIRFPLRYLRGSNAKRTAIVIATVITAVVLFACARLVDYYWFYDHFPRLRPKPKTKPPRPYGLMILSKIYTWGQVFVPVFTFLTILVVNGILLSTISRQHRHREKKLQAVSSKEKVCAKWYALPTLGACVVLYLVTQFPVLIDNLTYLLEKACTFQQNPDMQPIMRPIENIAMNLNFSINFVVYCGVHARFRQKLRRLVVFDWFGDGKRRRTLSQDSNRSLQTSLIRLRTKPDPGSV